MCVISSNRWNTSERMYSTEAGPIPYRSRSAARCSSADLSRNAISSTRRSTKASVTRTMDFARYPSFRARSSSSATAAIASGPQKQKRVLRSYESGVPYASRRACVIWMERRTTAFCRTIAMIRYSYRELHEAVRIPRHRARIGPTCGCPPRHRIVCHRTPGSHALSGEGKWSGLCIVASKWKGLIGERTTSRRAARRRVRPMAFHGRDAGPPHGCSARGGGSLTSRRGFGAPMGTALHEWLQEEFPLIAGEARVLHHLAYEAVAEFQRSLDPGAQAAELSDEDVLARLNDPRAFGLFAHRVLASRVSRQAKIGVAERAFDLIPIPASEHAAFPVEERTPPGLLRLARFLLENEAFMVLHLLHLIYAAYLDPRILREADRRTRTWVLMAMMAREELPDTERLLAAFQFLAAMAPRDAASAFHGIVSAKYVRPTVRAGLAAAASGSDGGRAWFAAVAVQEGLLPPPGSSEASAVEFEARVPAIPEAVRTRAREWLAARAKKGG